MPEAREEEAAPRRASLRMPGGARGRSRAWLLTIVLFLIVGNLVVLRALASGERTVTSELSTRNHSLPVGFPRLRAVFVGDSFSYAATASSQSWSRMLSDRLGWEEVNLGRGGTGYATSSTAGCGKRYCPSYVEMVAEVVKVRPEIVIVSGGANDAGKSNLRSSVNEFFRALRKSLPSARIIAVSPFWRASPYPEWLRELGQTVKAASQANNGQYLDIGHPFEGEPRFLAKDGIHPSVDGHVELARVVLSALEQG